MLKQLGRRWGIPLQLPSSPHLLHVFSNSICTSAALINFPADNKPLQLRSSHFCCRARRRAVRYDSDDDEDGEGDEYYGHNQEIALLELYTQSARGEALLVRALVDDQELQVLIFKGFSSSLSHRTSADPSRSVLPERAVIKSVDRIKGPFDPSSIHYIEKNIDWNAFKTRLPP